MDTQHASGDNNNDQVTVEKVTEKINNKSEEVSVLKERENKRVLCGESKGILRGEAERELEIANEKEANLKDRIANCKKIIESLKLELTEEKAKLHKESESSKTLLDPLLRSNSEYYGSISAFYDKLATDQFIQSDTTYLCNSNVDSKLGCDESLMEYEKQLEKYQNTLSMAQNQKKIAIRKQMLAKAFKLKLLEVENQCNIEILRVKQSLQCLEPLQMIVKQWKSNENNQTYNLNKFELIPRYPEPSTVSPRDVIFTDDEKSEFVTTNADV